MDRLHHRCENLLLRNEVDLAPHYLDDGESCRIIELIPDPTPNPRDQLIEKEATTNHERLKTEFSNFLGRERRLKSLFTCYENGIWKSHEVASQLHVSARAARNLQRRFQRRFHDFLEQHSLTE